MYPATRLDSDSSIMISEGCPNTLPQDDEYYYHQIKIDAIYRPVPQPIPRMRQNPVYECHELHGVFQLTGNEQVEHQHFISVIHNKS